MDFCKETLVKMLVWQILFLVFKRKKTMKKLVKKKGNDKENCIEKGYKNCYTFI